MIVAAEAKRRDAWDRAASLLALIANVHRDRKRRRQPFTVEELHPLNDKPRTAGRFDGIPVDANTLPILAKAMSRRPRDLVEP